MEATVERSAPRNLELSAVTYHRSPVFSSYLVDMHSARRLEAPARILPEKAYPLEGTLNEEISMSHLTRSPKSENFVQSMFSTVIGIFGDQLLKASNSFANMNSPLSVAVVQNEGIITQEFFKGLTTRQPEPIKRPSDTYVSCVTRKESLNIPEKVQDDLLADPRFGTIRTFDENLTERKTSSDVDFKNFVPLKDSSKNLVEEEPDKTIEFSSPALHSSPKDPEHTLARTFEYNCQDKARIDTDPLDESIESLEKPGTDASLEPGCLVKERAILDVFVNLMKKVVNRVTEKFNFNTDCSVDLEMPTKAPYAQRQKRKANPMAKRRGRGRARSQLRRSGVSQAQHRKERNKHDLDVDMREDYETWRELDLYQPAEKYDSSENFGTDEDMSEDGLIANESASPLSFTFVDVVPEKEKKAKGRKSSTELGMSTFSKRVRYVSECATGILNVFQGDHQKRDAGKDAFRPRLLSESSIDSEDSYCIVFETEAETEYEYDLRFSDSSDDDQTEDEFDDDQSDSKHDNLTRKVKFDLKPIIHTMVQWNYAYRAARRGPWEEMARDRERFKGRINCIQRVLDPVLTIQHRSRVWQERFVHVE